MSDQLANPLVGPLLVGVILILLKQAFDVVMFVHKRMNGKDDGHDDGHLAAMAARLEGIAARLDGVEDNVGRLRNQAHTAVAKLSEVQNELAELRGRPRDRRL